jgi:hypothetical protein
MKLIFSFFFFFHLLLFLSLLLFFFFLFLLGAAAITVVVVMASVHAYLTLLITMSVKPKTCKSLSACMGRRASLVAVEHALSL